MINDIPTSAIDYSGMSVRILYAQEGVDLQTDPYSYTHKKFRPLLKAILLIFLNAKNGRQQAMKAIRQKIREEPELCPEDFNPKTDLEPLVDGFQEQHPKIAKHFFSGVGVKLQFIDSQVAEKVLMDLYAEDIPVLPIHDSFICQETARDNLLEKMNQAYAYFVKGYFPKVDLKPTFSDYLFDYELDEKGTIKSFITPDGTEYFKDDSLEEESL